MRTCLLHIITGVFFAVGFLSAHTVEAQTLPADSLSSSTELRTIDAQGFLYQEGETWIYFAKNERSMRRLVAAQNSGDPSLVDRLAQGHEVFRAPNGTAVRVVDALDEYTKIEVIAPDLAIDGFTGLVLREHVRTSQ
jgi:hypothetical protein